MRKRLAWRAWWMGALVLLFGAGLASGQESEQPPSDAAAESSPATDATPTETEAWPGRDDLSNAINADIYNASSPYTGLPPLGTPPPLQQPQFSSLHLGPFYLTGISDSFYYSTINSDSGRYTTFWGNSISTGVILAKNIGENGELTFHASPQVLLSSGHAWFNEVNGLTYSDKLNERWTFYANTQLAYFQNSILTNPQYALVNTSGQYVIQTLYLQTLNPAFYQYSNVSLTYQLGTKTTLSISPTAGVSFSNSSGPFSTSFQFGGAVSVSHQYSERGSVSVFYGFSHSQVPGVNGLPSTSWNGSSVGVGLSQGLGGETWSLAFNVASNSQNVGGTAWSVIGSAALVKKLSQGAISANYVRSESTLLLQAPGYFDQGNLTYSRPFGQKWSTSVGVGAYRSNQNAQSVYVNNARGVRVSGSVNYLWSPNLSASAGFFVGEQHGAQGSQIYLFNGRSYTFNVGVNWTPGHISE